VVLLALRVIEYRQLLQILAMFMVVQFFGLLLATQVFSGVAFEQIMGAQEVSSTFDALFFIAYIIVFSIIILIIFKIYKGDKLFMLLDAAVVLVASFVVFIVCISALQGNAFNALFGATPYYVLVAAIALAVLLVIAKYKIPKMRNITAMIASVGVGLVIGVSFSFLAAMVFMIILAAYDYIAVFITKHMVALGNVAMEKNLSFLIMVNEVEAVPLSSLTASERAEYNKSKKEMQKHGASMQKLVGNDMAPISARMALGTGDLAMPLMLAIAAYKVNLNFVLSFVIILGAILGLVITMLILRRYKRALPAIPPILLGIVIALLVYLAVSLLA
jgi:presenilin-like A22 family membrane protease